MSKPTVNWHGDTHYFGLHYDLHAGKNETELGTRCGERELVPMLELMAPDFVQTDWISGDNAWGWGLDGSRCEARFLSTHGKPWDIMLWNFCCSHGIGKPDSPWTARLSDEMVAALKAYVENGGNLLVTGSESFDPHPCRHRSRIAETRDSSDE